MDASTLLVSLRAAGDNAGASAAAMAPPPSIPTHGGGVPTAQSAAAAAAHLQATAEQISEEEEDEKEGSLEEQYRGVWELLHHYRQQQGPHSMTPERLRLHAARRHHHHQTAAGCGSGGAEAGPQPGPHACDLRSDGVRLWAPATEALLAALPLHGQPGAPSARRPDAHDALHATSSDELTADATVQLTCAPSLQPGVVHAAKACGEAGSNGDACHAAASAEGALARPPPCLLLLHDAAAAAFHLGGSHAQATPGSRAVDDSIWLRSPSKGEISPKRARLMHEAAAAAAAAAEASASEALKAERLGQGFQSALPALRPLPAQGSAAAAADLARAGAPGMSEEAAMEQVLQERMDAESLPRDGIQDVWEEEHGSAEPPLLLERSQRSRRAPMWMQGELFVDPSKAFTAKGHTKRGSEADASVSAFDGTGAAAAAARRAPMAAMAGAAIALGRKRSRDAFAEGYASAPGDLLRNHFHAGPHHSHHQAGASLAAPPRPPGGPKPPLALPYEPVLLQWRMLAPGQQGRQAVDVVFAFNGMLFTGTALEQGPLPGHAPLLPAGRLPCAQGDTSEACKSGRCYLCNRREEACSRDQEPLHLASSGLGALMRVPLAPSDELPSAVRVHRQCALWSPEVLTNSRGQMVNLPEAIARGRRTKCSRCGERGATLKCWHQQCMQQFHLPCARLHSCTLVPEPYTVACPSHDPALLDEEAFVAGAGEQLPDITPFTSPFSRDQSAREQPSGAALRRGSHAGSSWSGGGGVRAPYQSLGGSGGRPASGAPWPAEAGSGGCEAPAREAVLAWGENGRRGSGRLLECDEEEEDEEEAFEEQEEEQRDEEQDDDADAVEAAELLTGMQKGELGSPARHVNGGRHRGSGSGSGGSAAGEEPGMASPSSDMDEDGEQQEEEGDDGDESGGEQRRDGDGTPTGGHTTRSGRVVAADYNKMTRGQVPPSARPALAGRRHAAPAGPWQQGGAVRHPAAGAWQQGPSLAAAQLLGGCPEGSATTPPSRAQARRSSSGSGVLHRALSGGQQSPPAHPYAALGAALPPPPAPPLALLCTAASAALAADDGAAATPEEGPSSPAGMEQLEHLWLGGTTGQAGRPGRCCVCVVQRKGKCGTESAPKKCYKRRLVSAFKAGGWTAAERVLDNMRRELSAGGRH